MNARERGWAHTAYACAVIGLVTGVAVGMNVGVFIATH